MTTGNVFSFWNFSQFFGSNDFKVSSTYIRNDLVDNTATSLIFLNLKIASWDIWSQQILWNALILTQQAQDLIDVDTISLLENSSDKNTVFDSHLWDIVKLNIEIDDILSELVEIAEHKRNESDWCRTQKVSSDKIFFNWLSNNDYESLLDWLDNSTTNSVCYEQNRVVSNAYFAVHDKLSYFNQLLYTKRNILDDNKEIIINNFQYFKTWHLEELITIRDLLKRYNSQWN